MMRMAIWIIVAVSVAGCAIRQPSEHPGSNRHLLSLTPKSLGRNMVLSQLVAGKHDGKTYRARYEIDVAGDILTIVGLSPIGLTLFILIQQGNSISVDNRLGDALTFDPRYTLFDLYLTYWPATALLPALEMNGMTLETTAAGKIRTVRDRGGRRVVTVTYPSGNTMGAATVIEHFDRPYRLKITPIKVPDGA